MFKVYKRTLYIGRKDAGQKIESSLHETNAISRDKPSNWFAIPAMIGGALAGALLFSVIFAAILLPFGILGLGAWLRFRKSRNTEQKQSIEAEYTVISEADNKSGKDPN